MRLALPLLLLLTSIAAESGDWPQFRGPGGQGHSDERKLPFEWGEDQNVTWKVPVVGQGWSSPVVAEGRVWLTTATIDEEAASLRAIAFDVRTGAEIVNSEVFRMTDARLLNFKNTHASPTPVVEGDRVYVHFGAEGTAALTTSGEIVWKTRFPYISQHGNGGSPVLYKDVLLLNCDGFDEAFVVAVDKNTGKVRWKTMRHRPISQAYTTPVVIRAGDRDQIVSIGAFRATAYDPDSGEEIWWVNYPDGFSNVPSPVYGNGRVYIATGFQQPSLLSVRIDGEGDVTQTHIEWIRRRAVPLTPSPLIVGEELYIVSDLGVISCLDAATGETHWQQRIVGNVSASPLYADGRIYFLSEEGVATVIAPGKEFRLLATNSIDGWTLASMAVSNGSIFLRSDENLYRFSVGPTAPSVGPHF
jgi:outer membrane protein assembly factor BamB